MPVRWLPILIAAFLAPPSLQATQPEARPPGELPFIVPNEFSSRLYEPWIRHQTGTLVSVGTFRTLTTAGLGSFSHVVMFDYDPQVQAFNRFNLELLGRAPTRLEYLNSLLELDLTPAELQLAHSSSADELRLLRSKLEAKLASNAELSWAKTYAGSYAASVSKDLRLVVLTQYLGDASPENWKSSIFGSNSIFERVQQLTRSGSFEIVQGSLVGTEEMQRLSARLKQRGLKVSVVDISNVAGTLHDNASLRQLAINIKSLPSDSSMLIMETGNARTYLQASADRWLYYIVPRDEYLASFPGRMFMSPQGFEVNRLTPWEVTRGARAQEIRCAVGYSAVGALRAQ